MIGAHEFDIGALYVSSKLNIPVLVVGRTAKKTLDVFTVYTHGSRDFCHHARARLQDLLVG